MTPLEKAIFSYLMGLTFRSDVKVPKQYADMLAPLITKTEEGDWEHWRKEVKWG